MKLKIVGQRSRPPLIYYSRKAADKQEQSAAATKDVHCHKTQEGMYTD